MAENPRLYLQFRDAVLTFSPEQVTHLTCLLPGRSPPIIQDGVPEEWTGEGPEGSLLWNRTSRFDRLKMDMIP